MADKTSAQNAPAPEVSNDLLTQIIADSDSDESTDQIEVEDQEEVESEEQQEYESEEEEEYESDDEEQEESEEESETEVDDELRAKLEFLDKNEARIAGLLRLEQELSGDNFEPALRDLIEGIGRVHKKSPAQILAILKDDANSSSDDEQDEGDFETDYEQQIYKRAKRDAIREVEQKLAPKLKAIERLEQLEQQRDEAQKLKSRIERDGHGWRARVESKTGWKPTASQLEKAMTSHPSLDPVTAVIAEFTEDIMKAASVRASKTKPRAKPMVKGVSSQPKAAKPAKDYGILDALSDN